MIQIENVSFGYSNENGALHNTVERCVYFALRRKRMRENYDHKACQRVDSSFYR